MHEDSSIGDWIRAAAAGDREAFSELVHATRARVVRTAFQITGDMEDAKDVAQGVFLRLWKVLRRYDPGRSFDTWLYRITVNAAIDHVRDRGPRGMLQPLPEDPAALGASGAEEPGTALDLSGLQRAFLRLASRLAPKQRAVFVLREIEGRETGEIAKILGVTESTVRNHLHQARGILREGIEREFPEWAPGRKARS